MERKEQQSKSHPGWEARDAWKTVAQVSLLTAAGALTTGIAMGQEAPAAPADSAPQADATPAQSGLRHFNIAPGDLTTALQAFHHATGIAVHSAVPEEKLAEFRSRGAQGDFTPQGALQHILLDTGLNIHFQSPTVADLNIERTDHVEVSAGVQQAGLQQFTEPLLDTAQTVNVVPQYVLSEQQDTTLRDGLRNVAGISLAAGEGGSQGDSLTIRGFNARNDIFIDGIRDFGSYYRDAFDYEAIDVLQGPAGVEFGRGSTGGVVNQETKQPALTPRVNADVQLGTDLMRRGTADLDEPIGGLRGGAIRVNVVGEESNVAGRNYTNVRRFGVAPSLAVGLNSPTRAFLTYLHEGENDLPDYGLPYFGAGPLPGLRNNYYGYAESDFFRTNPDIVTGRLEHDFGLHLSVRNALRFANYPRDVNITEPQINSVPVYNITGVVAGGRLVSGTVSAVCSPTAATPCYPVNTPPSQLTVRRNQIAVRSVEDQLWDQAGISGHHTWRRVANDFNVIVEGGRERSTPQRTAYPATVYASALSPNAYDIIPAAASIGVKTYVASQTYGFGFNDTLKPVSWLQLSGGVRFDYFNTDYISAPTHLSRLDKQPTYRAAVVAKPSRNGTVYFDYGTSFDPSAESLSLSTNNAVQAPQYNETYEGGAKWAFMHDRLNIDASGFQTTKTNVYETDPTNSLNVIPVGNQRVRGLTIGGLGHMPQHFDVIFGYAYLDGRTIGTEQNYSPFAAVTAYVNGATTSQTVNLYIPGNAVYGAAPYLITAAGNPFANVPKNSANLFVTHQLPWGMVGGFGFNQVGARRASSTGPVVLPFSTAATALSQLPLAFKSMPGYTAYNAMLRKGFNDHTYAQVNINNLSNAFFIDQPHPGHLIPSEAINAQFGMNYTF